MKALQYILLLFTALLLINCSNDNNPASTQNAPSTPVGVTAQPSDQQVTLTWDANTETDLSHYNIYQGISENALEKIGETPAGTTTYAAEELTNGTTYYFAIDAENTMGETSVQSSTVSATPVGLTVYVAGHETIEGNSVATLWKNGTTHSLTDGSSDAYAWSVFVYQDKAYVAGQTYNGGTSVATLWINDSPLYITDGSSNAQATSVYVSGGTIYVAGHEDNGSNYEAKLWKWDSNNIWFSETLSEANSRAHSVFISGGHEYVAGYEYNEENISVPVLWGDFGETDYLTDGSSNAQARSVYPFEGDVYVAGFGNNGEDGVARLWKNGLLLPDYTVSSNDAWAHSVFVSDNGEVYLTGGEKHNETNEYRATLWKNGTAQHLTDGTLGAAAYSVYVSNGDVYVAGGEYSSSENTVAKLWINGTEQTLSTSNAQAQSVVVKHN